MKKGLNPTAKIAKNSLVQLIAGMINKGLGVLLVIYAARQLGTDGFGTYSYILSIYSIFYIITDFGLGSIITRDVAQDSSREAQYFGNTLIIRMLLGLLAAATLLMTIWLLQQPAAMIRLTAIVAVALLVNSNVDTCAAIFNAHQRMEIPSTLNVVATTLRIAASLGALAVGAGVEVLIWIHSIIALIHFLMSYTALRYFVKPSYKLNKPFCQILLKQAFPIALAQFFSIIYFRVDTVMLGSLKDQTEVGIYNAAYRLLEFTLIFPAYYGGAIFPVIAASYKNNQQRFLLIYRRSIKYMWIMSLPMALGVMALAPKLILTIFGPNYQASIPILSVVMWSLLVIAINGVSMPYLIAMGKQRVITILALVMMLFNIALNYLVIPSYGALGAAWVTLVSEIINISLFVMVLVKPLSLNIKLLRHFYQPALAGAVMYGGLLLIKSWDLGFQIIGGAVLYVGSLLLFRAFDEIDRELFLRLLKPNSQSSVKVTD